MGHCTCTKAASSRQSNLGLDHDAHNWQLEAMRRYKSSALPAVITNVLLEVSIAPCDWVQYLLVLKFLKSAVNNTTVVETTDPGPVIP